MLSSGAADWDKTNARAQRVEQPHADCSLTE